MAITQSSNRLLTQADPTTNPSSGREEDLNPRPPDYKSSALTTRPHRLQSKEKLVFTEYNVYNTWAPFLELYEHTCDDDDYN